MKEKLFQQSYWYVRVVIRCHVQTAVFATAILVTGRVLYSLIKNAIGCGGAVSQCEFIKHVQAAWFPWHLLDSWRVAPFNDFEDVQHAGSSEHANICVVLLGRLWSRCHCPSHYVMSNLRSNYEKLDAKDMMRVPFTRRGSQRALCFHVPVFRFRSFSTRAFHVH